MRSDAPQRDGATSKTNSDCIISLPLYSTKKKSLPYVRVLYQKDQGPVHSFSNESQRSFLHPCASGKTWSNRNTTEVRLNPLPHLIQSLILREIQMKRHHWFSGMIYRRIISVDLADILTTQQSKFTHSITSLIYPNAFHHNIFMICVDVISKSSTSYYIFCVTHNQLQ